MTDAGLPLPDWLTHRATNTPHHVAVVAAGREWNYAELDDAAARTARQLASLGVVRGDRVAVLLDNGIGMVLLLHAVLRLRATLVPLNTRLSPNELAWQIGDCRPRVLVVDAVTAALANAAQGAHPHLVITSLDAAGAELLHCSVLEACDQRDVALSIMHDPAHVLAIVYTSGTTGRPKGAMLTVGNFWWSAIGSGLNLGIHTHDRWLACMPLFHVGGLSILLRSAIYGITAIVHDGFDAIAVNAEIDTGSVTIVSVVAVMLQRMLDAHDGKPYPESLRCVLLGGGPAPRALLERCAALGIPVAQSYGLTETTSQLATLAPADALRKLGSAGRPIYPNQIRISIDGRDAAHDETGEILVRGPVVMAGYAGQPQATARAIVDGWLHTGDAGSLDADGYLRVLDRRDDLVITGGENVYPAEVEAALIAHPSVIEAGVIGVTDSAWGQRVVAVVRLAESSHIDTALVADELRAHCRELLAGYKVPSEVRFVNHALPRTASGKLRRAAIRDRFTTHTATTIQRS